MYVEGEGTSEQIFRVPIQDNSSSILLLPHRCGEEPLNLTHYLSLRHKWYGTRLDHENLATDLK